MMLQLGIEVLSWVHTCSILHVMSQVVSVVMQRSTKHAHNVYPLDNCTGGVTAARSREVRRLSDECWKPTVEPGMRPKPALL